MKEKTSIRSCQFSLFLIFFILFSTSAHAQETEFRTVENDVFGHGEFLRYRVFYDSWLTTWITAGIGEMKVDEEPVIVSGRETWHVTVTGQSVGLFTLFFKVRDKFETFIDKQGMMPLKFIRRTHEGKYRIDDDVIFDQSRHTTVSRREKDTVPPYVQDIISSFYYLRTFDFDTAEVNDEYYLDFYLDDSVYNSRIVFLGREWVETSLGKFYCLKFKPQVAKGEVFQEPYPMMLWVSDDKNKIPVLGKSAVYVGSVSLELIDYSGLKYPLGEPPE